MLNKLLLKISGFIIIVSVISNMPEFFGGLLGFSSNKETNIITVISFIIINIIPFFIGVAMVLMSPIRESELPSLEHVRYEYLTILCLGIYLLFNSLSDLIFHFSNYLYISKNVDGEFSIRNYNYPMMIATIFELLIASLLLIIISQKRSKKEN